MKSRVLVTSFLIPASLLFGCSGPSSPSQAGVASSTGGRAVGGVTAQNELTGGSKATLASGGTTSFGVTGGTKSTGGFATVATGGQTATSTGGKSSTVGGAATTGGIATIGGSSSTVGGAATGGFVAIGGTSSAVSGADTGGIAAIGGTSSGGFSSSGGKSPTGGNSSGTGGTGLAVQTTVAVSGANPTPVAGTFFGENYWSWIPDWGDPVAAIQTSVAALKLNLIRAGGANNDQQNPVAFTQTEMDGFVAYARAIGAEPLVQIPLLKNLTGTATTTQDAASIVTYLNKTKAYGVKYFSIGNEPDLYTEQGFKDSSYSASVYCSTFSSFVSAMKAVDPTIKILGPELSWKYVAGNDWLTPFLQNCGSSVDIVSLHRYPFTAAQCTEANAYSDAATFRTAIASYRSIMSATGQGSKPLAITEANITWDGNPANPAQTASPQTFPAGLWVADSIGVALEAGLFSIDYWSLSEGYNLGFFSGTTPTPAYYALQMFSTKFGNQSLTVSGAPSNISVYAGRNASAAKTTVFVVNKTSTRTTLGVKFQGLVRADTIVVAAEARSITTAECPDNGGSPVVTSYASGMAQPAVVSN